MKSLRFFLFLSTLTFLPLSLHADEEEEEELQLPSKEETLAFCKKHIPIAIKLLEHVREEEGEEDYNHVLNEAAEHVLSYHEILEDDGKKFADLFLKELSLGLEVDMLVHQYHEVDKSFEDQAKTKDKLEKTVGKLMDLRLELTKAELDAIQEEEEHLRSEIKELTNDREARIQEELRKLIFGD